MAADDRKRIEIAEVRSGLDRHQPLAFPGQEHDGTEDLAYNVFRWYRAGWGRYTQVDRVGSPIYAYADGNPVRAIDPLKLYAIDRSGVKQIPMSNIAATCPGLGSACTLGVFAWLSCKCVCDSGGYAATPTLHIKGTMYYYPGNPKTLNKAKPIDKTVVDPASSIAHEWNWHINLAIAAVDPVIKELEQKAFATESECQGACTQSYGPWVNSAFASYLGIRKMQKIKRPSPAALLEKLWQC